MMVSSGALVVTELLEFLDRHLTRITPDRTAFRTVPFNVRTERIVV
jgi:hypothetical protein